MNTIMWFGFVLGALSATGTVIVTKPGQSQLLGALSATGTVIVTKPGQKATITCGVSSFTNNLVWRHGGDLIVENRWRGFPRRGSGDITKRSRLRQDTDLEISGVKEEDAGQFSCAVDGTSHEHTLLVVSVWTSPSGDLLLGSEATLQCQVKGLDQSSTVQWKRPDGSAHGGSHTAQLRPVERSHAGTWKCVFGGEAYSESLDINVKEPAPTTSAPVTLKGSKDIHNPTCPNCVTTTASAAQLLGLSWWLWVAIGVGSLVVILLVVCVIVLCKRIRRRKRKLQKMKYDRQLLKSKQYCKCNRSTAAAKPQQRRRKEKPSALPLQPQLME